MANCLYFFTGLWKAPLNGSAARHCDELNGLPEWPAIKRWWDAVVRNEHERLITHDVQALVENLQVSKSKN